MTKMPMRRRLFRATLGAVVGGAAMHGARAMPGRSSADPIGEVARLAFVNTHTGEALDVVYREGDRYLSDALAGIDRVLRDHRSGDVYPIDRALLDQLVQLGTLLDAGPRAFHVISGYRSAQTNALLAARSGGPYLPRRLARVKFRQGDPAPARRQAQCETAAGQRVDQLLVHAGLLEHVVGTGSQRVRLAVGEMRRLHQLHPGETHRADRPRRAADVARMGGARQHEAKARSEVGGVGHA